MITHTGTHIQKVGGADGTPCAIDIAVHAGRICRFGGAVWYPLLPHLVFVGLMAYQRSGSGVNLLWGFLHDAHEVVTSDVPRPFKCDCMREEQKAIDSRILKRFFGDHYFERIAHIDFPLIHQCDVDACDIEAVELGLPNYKEITAVHGVEAYSKYKPELHANADDIALFKRIMDSPFGQPDTISGQRSQGVTWLELALRWAEVGKYDGFLKEVKSWGLL